MIIDILTLFPKMFGSPFSESMIKRAHEKGLAKIRIHDLRKWSVDKHGTVDKPPYGGGPGMIMRVDVIDRALSDLKRKNIKTKKHIILLDPQGKTFNQEMARRLAKTKNLILICGHYEGYDERIRSMVDEEISIGNYVLTGGEIPAMVLIDTIVRLIPGVVGKPESLAEESFSEKDILEYSQYTRPENYKGMKVPPILLSGNHQKIAEWRKQKSLEKSQKRSVDT